MDKKYYIYMTTNLINGKKYIGKHYGYLDDNYLGSGKILLRAIEKYGKDNFQKEIIDISSSESENCEKEKYYIALYNACKNDMFYNIHEGGAGGYTTAGYTLEQKLELSKKFSLAHQGAKNCMYGKHHTQKTKDKISYHAKYIRDKSIYQTQEYKEKMSKAVSGKNNGMYGKHHSIESKQKMSESHKGIAAGKQNGMYGKKGEYAINGKIIEMYDKDYNFLKSFPSKQMVLDFLHLKGHIGLDKAIKNNTLYKGYYWKIISKKPKKEV